MVLKIVNINNFIESCCPELAVGWRVYILRLSVKLPHPFTFMALRRRVAHYFSPRSGHLDMWHRGRFSLNMSLARASSHKLLH
jgi:hypothetical protein